jgi:NAD(P)-dependent dehydrogenase (short-subunit alcohol dehydrogenase family)
VGFDGGAPGSGRGDRGDGGAVAVRQGVLILTDLFSQFRLDGDVAVVTGGASGIGRTIADAFVGVGARVAIFDRVAGGPDDYKVDVTDESQVKAAFDEVMKRHGRVDVLFNNAGIALRRPTTELSLEDWNKVVAVNMTGVFLCAREAARHMLTWPVTMAEARDARKRTAPTSSSGSAMRPIGVISSMRFMTSGFSVIGRISGVRTHVGAIALTRMPWRAHSTASARVMFTTAPFVAW